MAIQFLYPTGTTADRSADIIAAMNALPVWGGEIVFTEGEYYLANPVWANRANITFRCLGRWTARILRATTPTANVPLFASTFANTIMDGLFLQGDHASGSAEVSFGGSYSVVANCYINGFNKHAIEIGGDFPLVEYNVIEGWMDNVYTHFSLTPPAGTDFGSLYGIITPGNVATFSGRYMHNRVRGTRCNGIFVGGNNTNIEGNTLSECHRGWNYQNNAGHAFSGGGQIALAPTSGLPVPSNICLTDNHIGIASNVVRDKQTNIVEDTRWACGIEIDASNDVILTGNTIEEQPNAGLIIAGAYRTIVNGIVSKRNGTIYPQSNGFGIVVGSAAQSVQIKNYSIVDNYNGGIYVAAAADTQIGSGWFQGNGPTYPYQNNVVNSGVRTYVHPGANSWSGQQAVTLHC